jgi:hypothetical protein
VGCVLGCWLLSALEGWLEPAREGGRPRDVSPEVTEGALWSPAAPAAARAAKKRLQGAARKISQGTYTVLCEIPYYKKYLYIKSTTVDVPSSELELPQPLSP